MEANMLTFEELYALWKNLNDTLHPPKTDEPIYIMVKGGRISIKDCFTIMTIAERQRREAHSVSARYRVESHIHGPLTL